MTDEIHGLAAVGVPPPAGRETARATVDLDAIRRNVEVLREHAGSAAVMAVVKADAYGHGLVPSAGAAMSGGASWLGVAQLSEAMELRDSGIRAPVLSWLHVPGSDFAAAITADIDLSVSALWSLAEVADAARGLGRTARIHLKVDTGLGRNGAFGDDWQMLFPAARSLEAEGLVRVVGVWSHFVYADEPTHPTVRRQQEQFGQAVREAERAGCDLEVRHIANSAATLTNPGAAFDLVRPGLAIYGLSPVPLLGDSQSFGLTPAMTLSADLAVSKRVPAGQGLSYGHLYVTSQDTTVGLVPIGYADGIPRNATNVGPVSLGGARHTVSGRVCMDQFVVDLGPASGARAGDRVTLFGAGESGEPTAQDWAQATGTISYEIVSRIGSRVPRVYIGGQR
ncbi:MAG: alanine racemase [Actinobacteria bacterium]|nr:alanine racemase [Actinomycetota bacterium]